MSVIVVTGAAGHVGANLVRALLERGQSVRALVHRDLRALEGLDLEIVQGDVKDPDSLQRAFAGADLVYHAAAYISILAGEWRHLEGINALGTGNVVQACLQSGVRRLVHFSSVETLLGKPSRGLVDESHPLPDSGFISSYARSKAAGEERVMQGISRGLDAVVIYPTAIIGPHDYRLGLPNAGLLSICDGKRRALVDGGFDWVDVRDVVAGALRAAERAPCGGRYILAGHWASLLDLAFLAEEITCTPAPRFIFPLWLAHVGAPFAAVVSRLVGRRALYTTAALKPLSGSQRISCSRARRELDYEPRPLRETVVDTLEWFGRNGHHVGRFSSLYDDGR